jgi:hypothetical protein
MDTRLRVAGAWGLGLAVFYAVFVRFYQAAGGRIGLPEQITNAGRFHLASYLAGLLILVGGAACVVLTRRWTPALPRPLVLVTVVAPVVTGGVFALAHGVAGVVMNVLDLTGVITLDKPLLADPTPAVRAADAWWNILFYQPWFAAMGACLLLCALAYARAVGIRPRTIRRAGIAVAAVTAAGIALTLVAVATGTRVVVG